jgi:curved DNA-binding protein CbpA
MAETQASSVAELTTLAQQIYPKLDRTSYYDLLRVTGTATLSDIRASYYRIALALHPDRCQALQDATLRDQLESIYARVNEGYRVLLNPDKRAAYDRGLAAGTMRLDLVDRGPQGPKNPEDAVTHPEAKKFFRLGMTCLSRKEWKGAVMNFNFARTMEPSSQVIAEKLAQAQAAIKAQKTPG